MWFYTNAYISIPMFHTYTNCAADKTFNTGDTASNNCNTNYRIILLMMPFITSWCKPLKAAPSKRYASLPLE